MSVLADRGIFDYVISRENDSKDKRKKPSG